MGLVMASMSATNDKYPITTPLQAGLMRGIQPIDMAETSISVQVEDASYRVPGRAMQMTLTITNNGDSAGARGLLSETVKPSSASRSSG
jgi:methane/ammonia monooxygenase subunit B